MQSSFQTRRRFLKTAGAVSLGFMGLHHFISCTSGQKGSTLSELAESGPQGGYGPLLPDPAGILSLPKGFSYKIISRRGEPMSDGLLTPGKPDGMATFQAENGRTIIVRNHENSPKWLKEGAFGEENQLLSSLRKEDFYDFGQGKTPSLGGTTTLVYDEKEQRVLSQYLSLAGTNRNCAGGPTPWNSWITCEEDVTRAGATGEQDHGYNFEVPATEKIGIVRPVPLKAMGRFNHEAIAVDPRTGIVYQTEDRADGLIYRFIPETPGQLHKGGRLQALVLKDKKSADTRNWAELTGEKFPVGQEIAVEWMDLDETDSPNDDLRMRGFAAGAARFARGEGMWFGKNEVFFACTNGGLIQKGQIFKYIPSPAEGTPEEASQPGRLVLFAEPNDTDIVQNCDNLTVAPWGDVVTCEDNESPFIVGITPSGSFYKIAHNTGFASEFAGVVFSPGGKTLFVNIQHEGLTVAITGPWQG